MKHLFFLFVFFLSVCTFAQGPSSISGTVTDNDIETATLPFVNISLQGTNIATTSDENGHYSINVTPGFYTIEFSYMGYLTSVENVTVNAAEEKNLNKKLLSDSEVLTEVVIKARVNRQKESALLMEQKNLVEIKQHIGAEEFSKKGVGNAAAAVAKVTGISKAEGSGTMYVRGLGDRYNSTSLNGLPIPSNDTEKKNIDLELFPTDIIQYIGIDKIYSAKMYGDFAGGNIDIVSKDFQGRSLFEVEIGSNVNSNAVSQSEFQLQEGPNYFGFSKYTLPQNGLSSFGFSNSLKPESTLPIGSSVSVRAGKSFDIGSQSKLSLFATANFDSKFNYREGLNQSVSAQGAKLKSFNQKKYSHNTSAVGMFNAGLNIKPGSKIKYNFLFVNSAEQENDEYRGFIRDIAEENNGLIRRGTYNQTQLYVNQLLGDHKINDRLALNWGTSYNTVKSEMPDRTQNTLRMNTATNDYVFATNTTSDNHRYFQKLTENEIAASVSAAYKFGKTSDETFKGTFTVGYDGKFKTRDFEAIQFNFKIANNQSTTTVNPYNLDTFFNQSNFDQNYFSINTFNGTLEPQTYSGTQNINAAFATVTYQFSDKFTAVAGLRSEQLLQEVKWKTQLDNIGNKNTFDQNKLLPSIIGKYSLNEKSNLRIAASKTYTLPQFKEKALFVYEDVTEIKVGNPNLYPSDDYNFDLKYEFFPKSDETISLTAFGKYIQNPINEVTLASSTNDISFINTGDAGHALGLEFEVKKNLFSFGESQNNKISAGLNASYLKTEQKLSSDKVRAETAYNINLTHDKSSFTGASDLLLNPDLSFNRTWNTDKSLQMTVAYAYNSERLYALGSEMKGNLVDQAIGRFDFILKSSLSDKLGLSFTAKNLTDPSIERVQENAGAPITVLSYKNGIDFSLGINYQF